MKKTATLSSKHQVTVPAEVRRALGLKAGERVIFDVESSSQTTRVTLRRQPTLEELAGSVPVPADVARIPWSEVRQRAWVPDEARSNGSGRRV